MIEFVLFFLMKNFKIFSYPPSFDIFKKVTKEKKQKINHNKSNSVTRVENWVSFEKYQTTFISLRKRIAVTSRIFELRTFFFIHNEELKY